LQRKLRTKYHQNRPSFIGAITNKYSSAIAERPRCTAGY